MKTKLQIFTDNNILESLADSIRADKPLTQSEKEQLVILLDAEQDRNVKQPKTSVNAFMEDGIIHLSKYESDDPLWENNHIEVRDARGSKHESVLNILSNVLYQCDVKLKIEL